MERFDESNGENPFNETCRESGSYADALRKDYSSLEVGESVVANYHGKTKGQFRSMLTYVAADLCIGVKTKTNSAGVLWVKRVR